ncbi:MAG: transporter substrate-binding domain-containing protein [Candidatus Delongbacteria bacterium]|nr:transporter substrate-binding domain-containing protein [Candidatus Delongbacteria bacterium]MBN2833968.1 transporter substrate-binding domain-containing protein [Candidatus Delongbacteria bacterium]
MKFIVFFLSLVMFLQSEEIRVSADNWMPYNGTPGDKKEGFVIDVLKKIFNSEKITVTYDVKPWARAVQMGLDGEVDAVIGALTSDAEGFIFPEETIGNLANDFFVPVDSDWKYKDINSLIGKKIGIIKDYSYGEEFDKYIENNPKSFDTVGGENAIDLNIKKLAINRIDLLIDTKVVITFRAKELGMLDKIKYVGDDGKLDPMYVAFSPKNPNSKKYAKMFDDGVRKLRSSGELGKILEEYGLSDWK